MIISKEIKSLTKIELNDILHNSKIFFFVSIIFSVLLYFFKQDTFSMSILLCYILAVQRCIDKTKSDIYNGSFLFYINSNFYFFTIFITKILSTFILSLIPVICNIFCLASIKASNVLLFLLFDILCIANTFLLSLIFLKNTIITYFISISLVIFSYYIQKNNEPSIFFFLSIIVILIVTYKLSNILYKSKNVRTNLN